MLKNILMIIGLLLNTLDWVYADHCILQTTRIACPGQEKESYSKCEGMQICEERKIAATTTECLVLAQKACDNIRVDVTKYKKVTARFNEILLNGGKDFCTDRTDAFPYMHKTACN